jgi:hypothetical protein
LKLFAVAVDQDVAFLKRLEAAGRHGQQKTTDPEQGGLQPISFLTFANWQTIFTIALRDCPR